jgi:biotin carboxylase
MLIPTATYRAEAFVRAAQRLPLDLSIASEVPSSLAHLHPVDLPAFSFSQSRDVVAAAKTLAASARIDGVVAVDDASVLAASLVANTLGLPHHAPDAVRAALNKYFARERMRAAGLDVPRFRLVAVDAEPRAAARDVARDVGYPAVLKPLAMAASRGVVRVNSPEEFASAFGRLVALVRGAPSAHDEIANRHVLAETYIPGHEVAVEGIVERGVFHMFAVFDKVDPLEGPYFPETMYVTPSRLSDPIQARIEAVTRDTIAAMGLDHGPVHVELRIDGERIVPIEAHARSIGGYCSKVLRFEGGRSLEEIIILQALGLLGTVPAREEKAAGVWMMQAPRGGRFVEMRGVSAATSVAHVDEVIVSARPAQTLTPLPDGFLYLGFIFARAGTPSEVEGALRTAFSRLEPVFDGTA